MFEYKRPEWTFHAKGAWIYEDGASYPQATIIGSSNFSYRSNRRDTECQMYIVSECEEFQKEMHEECEAMYQQSDEVTAQSIKNDKKDKFKLMDRILAYFLGSFL